MKYLATLSLIALSCAGLLAEYPMPPAAPTPPQKGRGATQRAEIKKDQEAAIKQSTEISERIADGMAQAAKTSAAKNMTYGTGPEFYLQTATAYLKKGNATAAITQIEIAEKILAKRFILLKIPPEAKPSPSPSK